MSDAVMTITANDIAGIIESRAEVEDGYLGNAGYIAHEIYLTMLAASPSVGGWEVVAWMDEHHDWDVLSAIKKRDYELLGGTYVDSLSRYNRPLYAAPPPVSTGSRPQEAVPTEQAGPAVVPGWDQEICTGCTASLSIADIKARGIVSCCPDRHMVRIGDLVDAYTARPPTILPQTEKGS